MQDALLIFSQAQAITVSAASNWPMTGAGSFAAGVLDTGGEGSIGDAVKKYPLIVSVGVPFAGPLGSTLSVFLQESNNGTIWTNSDLGNAVVNTLALGSLFTAGFVLLKGLSPMSGSGPNGKLGQYLRVFYTVAGGPFTLGTVNAWYDVW